MKKKENKNGLPDLCLSVVREAKQAQGEDSYCYSFCENAGLVAVFDGCGGLGAQRHYVFSDYTEAYVASRLCAGAFYDAFQDLFPAMAGEEAAAQEYVRLSSEYCETVLSGHKPPVDPSNIMRGSMVKTLPTTAAAALIRLGNGLSTVTPIWAGDSRVYLLTPDGLAQLTVDDTSVSDPMENLYQDGVLRNMLTADRAPRLHWREYPIEGPFAVLAATDGCFGYFSTPMEFEGALLRTLQASSSAGEWEQRLAEVIGAVAGDDYTLTMGVYGFGRFRQLQKAFAKRLELLEAEFLRDLDYLPLEDRAPRQQLWDYYKPDYMRYIKE